MSILFIGAIILSSWSILSSNKSSSYKPPDPSEPDAYMEDINAVMIDKVGNPALKITSPKMIHYAENDTTDMTTPYITIYRQSPEPWYIQSDYAKATGGIDQIYFWSNVIIHHAEDISVEKTIMKTASLTVFPEKQIASTDEAVLITQPDLTIKAKGMWANLKEGTVKLLSETRGEYVPKS